MQSTSIVIGIGNEYCGDDGAGLAVVRELKACAKLPSAVRVVEAGMSDMASLLDCWDKESQVILIDAVSSSALPGTIYQFDALHQTLPAKVSFGSTHGFGVAEAIMLAKVLEQLPSKLFVYGIEGRDFSLHRGLSQEVEKSVQEVSNLVLQTLCGWHTCFS